MINETIVPYWSERTTGLNDEQANYEEAARMRSDDKEKEATKRDIQTGRYFFDDIYCLKERRDLDDAVSLNLFDAVCPLKR